MFDRKLGCILSTGNGFYNVYNTIHKSQTRTMMYSLNALAVLGWSCQSQCSQDLSLYIVNSLNMERIYVVLFKTQLQSALQ